MGESNRVSSLDNYIAYTTVVAETTQKSAESVGESFKTLYARFGKIAAGKFETSQEELEQEGLSSEDMSNLNEIEQVLKAVGIELRDTPEHFRDIDSVLAEIAGKWNTFSDVQKSGIATAVAGTRQRENFLVLMENWDNVGKYAEIAANAYGTAVEKMEAYSQGVEAARKRVQAAWEGFALIVNESGALETAFNALATAIENLHLIVLSLIGALVVNNPEAALGTLTAAFTKLGTFLNTRGLEGMLGSGKKDTFTKQFQENLRKQSVNNAFVAQKQAMFGDYLGNFKGNLDSNRFAGMVEYQSGLIGLEKNVSNAQFLQGLEALSGGINLKDTLKMGEGLRLLNSSVLTGEQAQIVLNTVTKEVSDALIKEKMAVAQGTTDEEKLAWARQAAAKDLLIDMTEGDKSKYYDKSARRTFTAATGTGIRGNELEQREMQNRAYTSMAGSVIGMYGARTLMGNLAAGVGGEDARSAGESIGSIIGMFAGEKAASSLFTAIKGVMRGTMAKAALAAPIIGTAVLAIGAIIGLVSAARKKEIEKAQNEFKELKDTYESQLSVSTKANQYDELAKRVDQFGRNVSLSEEEYKEFLSVSNELAEVFPDLVVRTDAAGNSFLGTAGKVGKLTEAIDEMVKKSQDAADQALLKDDVFGTAFDDIKDESKKGEKEIANLQKAIDLRKNILSNLTDKEKAQGYTEDKYGKKHYISAYEREIDEFEAQIKDIQNFDLSGLADYNNAIMRQDEDLQTTLNSLSEESAIMAKQTMTNVFSNLDISEYKNKDEYRAEIENLSNKIAEVYKNNPRLVDLEANRTGNAGEYFGNRKKLLESLVDSFGGYADLDESEKKILIGIGFEFDEDSNTWVDAKDTIRTIGREFGFRKTNKKNGITAENLGQLSTEDVDKVYGYLKSGEINKYTSMDTIVNMLYADREVPKNIPIMTKYVETLSKQAEEAKSVLSDMSFDDWKAMDKDQLQKTFSSLPEAWRNGIKGIKDAIDNGDFGEDELKDKLDSLYQTLGSGVIDASSELAKLSLNKVFSASQLTDDIDGIVDSMSELQKALKAVAESYDALKEAQKEQNAHRKLSLSTVVDLLATNMNYAQVLEFETDAETGKTTAIRLAANAQQIMNQMQIDAIKANLEVAIANNNLAIQEKQKQISLLKGETVTNNANKQTEDAITLTQVWGKVTTRIAKALARVVTLLGALKSGSSIKSALEQAENASNAISEWDDVEWVTKYQSMSRDERETAIQNLRDEIVDLQNENKTYRYTADNLNANNIGSELRGYVKNNDENAKKEFEDWLNALEGIYNKEFYLRKSLIEKMNLSATSQDVYMDDAYYDKMYDIYEMQATYYKSMLPEGKALADYSSEELGYLQKYQETMVKINNLDDEQVEDKINILKLQDASLDTLIAIQKEYITTSDTLQERLEREQELNNLLEERRNLYRDTQEYERWIADYNISHLKGTAYTNPTLYDQQIEIKKSTIENQQNSLIESINAAKNRIAQNLMENEGLSSADAYLKAAQSEEVRSLMKEYYELAKEYSEVIMEAINDKVDEISKKIDNINKERPKQWTSISQIEKSYDSEVDYINKQIDIYREALKDVSKLNDDQINELVNGLNEAVISLHEAKINRGESIKELQEKQYSAAIAQIDIYKQEIQDAIDAIETAYDKEYQRIKENNTERERAIKLEDLLAAKKKAAQEKEKVYRAGIGWTWESNRSAQKEAQENLDSFYREDKLTDLEETKNADVKRLEQRISDWEAYAKALEYKYGAHDREENQKLLMDLLGVDNMDDVRDKMTGDMTSYVTEAKKGLDNFTELSYNFKGTIEAIYKDYNTIFNDFLNNYKKNLEELQKLYEESLKMEDASGYLGKNDVIVAPYTTPSNSVNRDLLAEMMKNSNEWFEIQKKLASDELTAAERMALEDRQKELHASNEDLAEILALVSNNNLNKGNWSGETVTVGGKNLQTSAAYVMIDGKAYLPNEAASKLDALSKAWHEATTQAEKDRIAAEGKEIGESLGWKRDDATGVWHEDATAKANTKNSYASSDNRTYLTNMANGKDWNGRPANQGQINWAKAELAKLDKKGSGSSGSGSHSGGSGGGSHSGSSGGGKTNSSSDNRTYLTNMANGKDWDGSPANQGQINWAKAELAKLDKKGHANGILGGPITYTGLSMLHGTPSAPEYVLNADQAYTLLRNISTMQIPEYTSLLSNAGETQYILQGDVIIDGTENPENFWDAVTNQMRNRYSVTKNNKRA